MFTVVCYYRVSTKKQEQSGLGLEAQRAAVQQFVQTRGASVLAEYTEVETGKRLDRRELTKAIAHAKRAKATLVVAKLDRLARNVAFTSALLESGVEFLACDNPHANRLTIHILAAVAEDEARRISDRTKAALAAYKTRGGKLGATRPECRNLNSEARRRGTQSAANAARKRATSALADLGDLITKLRGGGFSYVDIAALLNAQGHRTQTGNPWTDVAVRRAFLRLSGPQQVSLDKPH